MSAGGTTVHSGGIVTFAVPHGWVRKALLHGSNPTSEADFRVPVATGCTALAFVSPQSSASSQSALAQLRQDLPAAAELGVPYPQPGRIVAGARRDHSGAWELIAPPAPTDGGDSFNYYGGVLLQVTRSRWAGLSVGITARPASCGAQVLHTRAIRAAADRILRGATLEGVTGSRG